MQEKATFFDIAGLLIAVGSIIFLFISFFPYDLKPSFASYLVIVLFPILVLYGYLTGENVVHPE